MGRVSRVGWGGGGSQPYPLSLYFSGLFKDCKISKGILLLHSVTSLTKINFAPLDLKSLCSRCKKAEFEKLLLTQKFP